MTITECIKEKLTLLRTIVAAVVGILLLVPFYNLKPSITYLSEGILALFLIYLSIPYKRLLDKLKELHEPCDVKLVDSTTFEKKEELNVHSETTDTNLEVPLPPKIQEFDKDFNRIFDFVKLEMESENRFIQRGSFLAIGLISALYAASQIFKNVDFFSFILPISIFLSVLMVSALIVMAKTHQAIWRYMDKHYNYYIKFKNSKLK